MISCDFAPNEAWDDAWIAFKLILQPWKWKKGKELDLIKEILLQKIYGSCQKFPSRQCSTCVERPQDLCAVGIPPSSATHKFSANLFLSGRSALNYLLKSLNLPKESEIIVQGFTCEAVVLPILANNLRPVYVDIETESFSFDPIDLEKKITSKTRTIILQHSFGITPKHREIIISIAKQHRLLLIEDIAHGFQSQKLKVKSQKSIYLMSFGRSKAISSVFGGAIVTNNKSIARKLELIEKNLPKPNLFFIFRTVIYKPLSMVIRLTYDFLLGKIIHKLINLFAIFPPEITKKEKRGEYSSFFDKAYPNALAILLLHQLNKVDQVNKQRAKICQVYQRKISNLKSKISNLALSRYPLLVKNRSPIITKAQKQNIFLGNWYNQPVGPASLNLAKVQYQLGSCPVAEEVCQHIINLPTNITIVSAKRIITLILNKKSVKCADF